MNPTDRSVHHLVQQERQNKKKEKNTTSGTIDYSDVRLQHTFLQSSRNEEEVFVYPCREKALLSASHQSALELFDFSLLPTERPTMMVLEKEGSVNSRCVCFLSRAQ